MAFETINKGGEDRVLLDPRLLEITSPKAAGVRVFGDGPDAEFKMIPRSQWKEVDYSAYVDYIHDQNGVGQCNLSATAGTMEVLRNMTGLPFAKLSAAYMYWHVNPGRDYNDGTMLEDGLAFARDKGACTTDLYPYVTKQRLGFTPAMADDALQYRITEYNWCPTFDHIASALLCGFPSVDLGVMVGGNFDADQDGWVPRQASGRKGGHAMRGVGLLYHPGWKLWGVKVPNSWTERWGRRGYGVIPETYFRGPFNTNWVARGVVWSGKPIPQMES